MILYPPLWEQWEHLAAPYTHLLAPKMALLAGDLDPPILEGTGTLTLSLVLGGAMTPPREGLDLTNGDHAILARPWCCEIRDAA